MRKIISLLVAVVCAASCAVTAFAANPKLTEQVAVISGVTINEAHPGQKIWLPLKKEAFGDAEQDLTMSDVKASKITLKQSTKSGSKAIASVEIKEDSDKVANILVTLIDPYTSTKPLDFETSIYLYIDGKRQGYETLVSGTLQNSETIVSSDTDYIDLSDGQTAKCEETSGKVEAYIGQDVSIFIKMLKGKDYYGSVTLEPDDKDLSVMDKYADITDVYNLTTIGLKGSGNIVKINPQVSYYVYDSDLEYLGQTSEMLPYSDKFYLAEKKLDIDENEAASESEDESADKDADADADEDSDSEMPENGDNADKDAESSGETTAAAPGKEGNPDTGAPKALGIAMASCMLSLGVIAALRAKKTSKKK